MKAVVLAGGFGRRLLPLTKDTPKPLLPVAGRPIIEHIMEKLSVIEGLDRIYISVNGRFESNFRKWADSFNAGKEVEIFAEKSMREEDKMGAVGALGHLLREKGIDDDILVVAGDNIFEFEISKFISERVDGIPAVALYDMVDKEKVSGKYGVVKIDEKNVITEFHEKPKYPASAIISTGCYFIPKGAVGMIHKYLEKGHNADAPGFFISWLSRQMSVQGFVFDSGSRWFDIGSIETYNDANRIFSKKL
jgi:glucose-1-phosphate thymidylyltransferase